LAVHLPLISAPRRWPGSWLQPGSPVAPARSHLPLLPPGPDGVHEFAPHGTGPSNTTYPVLTLKAAKTGGRD